MMNDDWCFYFKIKKNNCKFFLDIHILLCDITIYNVYIIKEKQMNPFTLTFDNAGGILLQTESYCHHYKYPEFAATDVYCLLKGQDPASWDNNEPEYSTDNYDFDQSDIAEILSKPFNQDRHSGYAEQEFFWHLKYEMEGPMYLVIQKGYLLVGKGHTKEEAVEDMKEWIDKDSELQDWTVSDFESCYNSANDGQMVLVELTKELAEHYDVDLGGE
jgi:hypothetical protein